MSVLKLRVNEIARLYAQFNLVAIAFMDYDFVRQYSVAALYSSNDIIFSSSGSLAIAINSASSYGVRWSVISNFLFLF